MVLLKRSLLLMLILLTIFSLGACKKGGGGGSVEEPQASLLEGSGPHYLAHNMWYEKMDAVYSTNYKTGSIIPAGTKITSAEIEKHRWRNTPIIQITTAEEQTFKIPFYEEHHSGLTVEEYADRLITTKSLDEMTAGLPEEHVDAIKRGKLAKGMSKDTVLITWGYPPESQTFSLDNNRWIYNINRFRTTEIIFDESGKLKAF
ncbi:MAG: hypothetical protein ACLFUS_15985 [Candidatus Sumerlaeia bacterium]